MPFVLFIIFGLWLLAICANDRGKQILRGNNFPLMKHQEEYILFYELYVQYRQDHKRSDPAGDAIEDARKKLLDDGYLPTSFRNYGKADWKCRPLTRRAPLRFPSGNTPRYSELLYYREKDCRSGGFQTNFIRFYGKDVAVDEAQWQAYCATIDKRFLNLVEAYNIERFVMRQNRPLAATLEYLLACCQMTAPRDVQQGSLAGTSWTLWAVKTEILQRGYLPTSLKPRSGNPHYNTADLYTPEWPPKEECFKRLLDIDVVYWEQHNIAEFQSYRELTTSFYQQLQACDKITESTYKTLIGYNERFSMYDSQTWGNCVVLENPFTHLGNDGPRLDWPAEEWITPGYPYGWSEWMLDYIQQQ